ncbi:MAG: prolipoprotein diacylglyceryl transferase [Clostridia bacterium]|nr:prolipoprotein diacylglyceryl transferase [Clostridia bacterium]
MQDFKIMGYSFSSYWTMLAIGAVVAVLLGVLRARSYEINKIKAVVIAFFVVILGCLGAKLLYILESPNSSFSWRGGMSLYGSIYLIPFGFIFIALLLRIRYSKCMDFVAVYGPLFFAIMRIGCYISNCCGGIVMNVFGKTFVPPVQLIECVLDIFILIFLLWREKNTKRSVNGKQYPIFMISYAGIRFFIEFIRSTPKIYWGFSEGQWLSLLTFSIGLIILYLLKRSKDYENYN